MRWLPSGLTGKLLVSHLLVAAAVMATIFVAVRAVAPTLINVHIHQMMRAEGGATMGPGTLLETHLQRAFLDAMVQGLLVGAGTALVVASGLSLFVSRQIAGPISRMVRATRHIASGHYDERVPVDVARAGDELRDLTESFNEMAGSLEQTEQRRLELIGDVAHELRTPISTFEGYMEGLLDRVVEPSDETWATLLDEAGRLRRLVDDLQELSRAESRQIPLTITAVPPAQIVDAAVERVRTRYESKGLELHTCVDEGLPPVDADLARAVQVLTNLLTNALRYTPAPGSVDVVVRSSDGAVLFAVTDTGVGLAQDDLQRVFERFYRVDKSRSRALGGSGIGLAIARALIQEMGGRIWAESEGTSRGSRFSFTLPVTQVDTAIS